jgi:hypothetical protein
VESNCLSRIFRLRVVRQIDPQEIPRDRVVVRNTAPSQNLLRINPLSVSVLPPPSEASLEIGNVFAGC